MVIVIQWSSCVPFCVELKTGAEALYL